MVSPDGNGRTARLMSGYIMDTRGYGFNGIGSLEEYFAYDPDEYYSSLQMGLPALYYSGRENPPHPEIWIEYFLRMVELYSSKVYEITQNSEEDQLAGLSYLNMKEKEYRKLLSFLRSKVCVVEKFLSSKDYYKIDFKYVPVKAFFKYEKVFKTKLNSEYLNNVDKKAKREIIPRKYMTSTLKKYINMLNK